MKLFNKKAEPKTEYEIKKEWKLRENPPIHINDIFVHRYGKVIEVLDIAISHQNTSRNIIYRYIDSTTSIHWVRDEYSFFKEYKEKGVWTPTFQKADIIKDSICKDGFDPILTNKFLGYANDWEDEKRRFERYIPEIDSYTDIRIAYVYEFHGEVYIIYDEYYYGDMIYCLGIQNDTRHVIKLSDWFTTVEDKNGVLHPKFRKAVQ